MEYGQIYDDQNRFWFTPPHNGFSIKQLVGPAILHQLQTLEPKRILEVNDDDGRQTTAAEMRTLALTCAVNLQKLEVGNEDVVVFLCQLNSLITPTCFGCFMVGAIVSPVLLTMTEEEIIKILRFLEPTVIIYDSDYKAMLDGLMKRACLMRLKHFLITNNSREQSLMKVLFKPVEYSDLENFTCPDLGDPNDVVLCQTVKSDLSGTLKAVKISHKLYLHGLSAWFEEVHGMKVYFSSTFGWSTQLSELSQPVFLDQIRIYSSASPSSQYVIRVIRSSRATHLYCTTQKLADIIEYCDHNKMYHYLRSIEKVMTGGDTVTSALKANCYKAFPGCQFINTYGMIETSGCIASDELVKKKLGMLIHRGVQLMIVDEEFNQLGQHQIGRILVKCQADFLVPKRDADHDYFNGWLVTGDLGYMNENDLLHVMGRISDVFYLDGEMIFPSAIEEIAANHPAVVQAAVVSIPHSEPHRGCQAVVFINLKTIYINTEEEDSIREDVLKILKVELELAKFWDKIHSIQFIDKFKISPMGKIDRQSLRAMMIKHPK